MCRHFFQRSIISLVICGWLANLVQASETWFGAESRVGGIASFFDRKVAYGVPTFNVTTDAAHEQAHAIMDMVKDASGLRFSGSGSALSVGDASSGNYGRAHIYPGTQYIRYLLATNQVSPGGSLSVTANANIGVTLSASTNPTYQFDPNAFLDGDAEFGIAPILGYGNNAGNPSQGAQLNYRYWTGTWDQSFTNFPYSPNGLTDSFDKQNGLAVHTGPTNYEDGGGTTADPSLIRSDQLSVQFPATDGEPFAFGAFISFTAMAEVQENPGPGAGSASAFGHTSISEPSFNATVIPESVNPLGYVYPAGDFLTITHGPLSARLAAGQNWGPGYSDILTTTHNGSADVYFDSENYAHVGSNSSFTFVAPPPATPTEKIIELIKGVIHLIESGHGVHISTHNCVIGVLGTDFSVSYEELGGFGTTIVSVNSGIVDVTTATGAIFELSAGQTLTIHLPNLLGDANGDGVVNGLDISLIASNWLHAGASISGDVNDDRVINGLDISLIASHWLQTSGASAAAVPEPSTLILAALAAIMPLMVRGQRT